MANIIRLSQIQSNAGNLAMNLNTNTQKVEFTGGFIPASLVIPSWAGENNRPTSGITPGYLGYNSTDVQLEVYYGLDPDDGSQVWGTTAGRVTGAVDVTDTINIESEGNPSSIAYIAMPNGPRTFLSFITSFGINQNSGNNNNSQWRAGFSGRIPILAEPRSNTSYFNDNGGVKFISGDGSSDSGDWAVIDFSPDWNYDFDGYYRDNTRGKFFGGENTSSGGGANGMTKGRLWGFDDSEGWVLLYELPLGDRQGTWSHRNSNWWNSGGTVTSGNGKRSAYDTASISYIGFSVQ